MGHKKRGRAGSEVAHAALRGAIAAMSMSGMRTLTNRLGLVEETPPEMITREKAPEIVSRLSPARRDAVIVLLHWAYGAGGGAVFGALPDRLRRKPWAGPIYGLVLWLGFETVLGPVLGLHMRRERPVTERAALAFDHLLYGAVLSEFRRRPRH
jgi:hypothetical protein